MQTEDTTVVVERILAGLENASVFIDPIIEPGMNDAVREATEAAVARSENQGVAAFVALIPGLIDWRSHERETIARRIDRYARERDPGAPTIAVLATVDQGTSDWAGIASEGDGGGANVLDNSQLWEVEERVGLGGTVEFAVAQCLAEVTGAPSPEMPPSRELILDREALDYLIEPGSPDAIVATVAFVASAAGIAWLIARRDREGWKRVVTRVSSSMTALSADAWREAATGVPLPEDPTQVQVDAFDRVALIDEAIGVLGHTLGLERAASQVKSAGGRESGWDQKAVRATLSRGRVEDVVALAVLGRVRGNVLAQIRSAESGMPPKTCFFHPLHPEATRERSWKAGRQRLTVPCCPECARALEKHGDPRSLMVAGKGGKPTPYFVTDSVYARTGYGAFRPLEAAIVENSVARESR